MAVQGLGGGYSGVLMHVVLMSWVDQEEISQQRCFERYQCKLGQHNKGLALKKDSIQAN